MGHAMAQVRIQRTNLMPEDVIVNTFHFETLDANVGTSAALTIAERVRDFYITTPAGSTASLQQFFPSNVVGLSNHEVRVYDMLLPKPRAPIVTLLFNMAVPAGQAALPAEVALCLSFKAASVSGVPANRSRGRIYFGPLKATSASSTAGSDTRPDSALQTLLANAGNQLRISSSTNPWVVASFVPGPNAILKPVVSCWVDDAFDSQRRRGAQAIARVIRPSP